MAWSSLANNQMPSELDASTSGFPLQSGQSHGSSNLCLTKDAANTKYLLDSALQAGIAGNQLLQKDKWASGTPPAPVGKGLAGPIYDTAVKTTDSGVSFSDSIFGYGEWTAVLVAANGYYQFTAEENGNIKRSVNGAAATTVKSGLGFISAIDSSADGQYLCASPYGNYIWKSNDYGATWTSITAVGTQNFGGCCVDNSGQYMMAYVVSGSCWRSSDYGVTWTNAGAATLGYRQISMKNHARRYLAISGGSYMKLSQDEGVTFYDITSAGSRNWYGVSASYGAHVTAIDYGGYIYVSSDYGTTWTAKTAAGTGDWNDISVSPDGSFQIACKFGSDYLYTSSDYGVTWIQHTELGLKSYRAVSANN